VTSWTEIYASQVEDVRDGLAAGPVVLSGVPGCGRVALAAELGAGRPLLELRPARAGTAEGLRADAARDLVRLFDVVVDGRVSRAQFRTLIAEAFKSKARDALAVAEGTPDGDLSFGDIVEAIPSRALVVVHDAHLLAEAWAERALWTLRARWQQSDPPWLVLLTRPWHESALTGRDAAFFGFARAFELIPPDIGRWAELGDYRVAPDDLTWLLEQTRGLPRPTLAALARLRIQGPDVRAAWAVQVAEARPTAQWVDRLAHGLHPYGPRLLAAIAGRRPVYPAVPGARTDAIAAALRAMRDHDLIYQPIRRRWVIADPALVSHLASMATTPARETTTAERP
jgi:hypothetical protein